MCIYHSCPWQCDQLSSFLQPNKLDFHCTQTWAPFCRMAFSLENEKEIAYYLTRESHVTTKGKPNMKDRKKFHRYFLWKKKKKTIILFILLWDGGITWAVCPRVKLHEPILQFSQNIGLIVLKKNLDISTKSKITKIVFIKNYRNFVRAIVMSGSRKVCVLWLVTFFLLNPRSCRG